MRIIPVAVPLALAAVLLPFDLPAQSADQDRPLLPRAAEVRLARSAAPPEVSRDATVYVLERGGFVLAARGNNGVTCLVDRSRPGSLEPHCFDPEASATILPIRLHEMELREMGRTTAEIERATAEGLHSGRFRLPARPAMSYMMSSGQVLINDSGTPVGNWKPHLMIYQPYITTEHLGLGPHGTVRAAVVADPGTALSSIVVVTADFVSPDEFPLEP